MIEVADCMSHVDKLMDSDSYFYVDDSVVFAKNINSDLFGELIQRLNNSVTEAQKIGRNIQLWDRIYCHKQWI